MRIRSIVTLLATLLLITAAAMWLFTSTLFIDWYLAFQCKRSWGISFSHSGIVKIEDRWIISEPSLISEQKVAGATFDAKAHSLEFSYRFRPLAWELAIEMRIVQPEVLVRESDVDWNAFIMEQTRLGPLVRLAPKIEIEHGQITFVHGEESTQPLHFEFLLDLIKGRKGNLLVYLDPENPKHDSLEIDIQRKTRKAYQAVIQINALDLSTLVEAGKTLMPQWMDWEIESGVLNGSAEINLMRGKKVQYSGAFACKDLRFSHYHAELQGHFPEIAFACRENSKVWSCMIPNCGSMTLQKNEQPFWEFKDIQGGIEWIPNSQSTMILHSRCFHDGTEHNLVVEGGGFFEEEHQEAVTLTCMLTQGIDDPVKTRLFYRHLGEHNQCLELELKRLQPASFELASHLAHLFFDIPSVSMQNGQVDGALIAFIENGYLTDVKIEELHAEEIALTVFPLATSLHAHLLTGQIDLNAHASNVLQTLNADFRIEEGGVSFVGPEHSEISEIATEIKIREGNLQPSTFAASLAGLKGTITLNHEGNLFHGVFDGPLRGLSFFGSDVAAPFINDDLQLMLNLARYEDGLQFEGSAMIGKAETIHFGCCLIKDTDLYSKELSIAGFRVADGWFNAVDVPLEKYIAPFFIRDKNATLTGRGDFQGGFNQHTLTINYDARDLCIANEFFEAKVPELAADKWAIQVFCLDTGEIEGIIPIKEAEFLDKKTGLHFRGTQASIHIDNSLIEISGIETFCNDIYFTGNINVLPNSATEIRIDQVSGKLSNLRKILGHFQLAETLSQVPFEASIAQRNPYNLISYNPELENPWQISLSLALSDGVFEIKSKNVKLEDFQANLDFDLNRKLLALTDVQGMLLLGKFTHAEEYMIAADHIRFDDYVHSQSHFDLWIGEKKRDVVRLIGETMQVNDEIQIVLDIAKSHIGDAHLTNFTFTLQDWTTPLRLHADLEFELQTLFYDLQKLGRTKLISFSTHLLERFEEWKSGKGQFQVALDYNKFNSTFSYDLLGKNIIIDEFSLDQVSLHGRAQHNQWSIDELKIDEWSLTAGITPQEEGIEVHYLGAKCGDALLVGMKGNYDYKRKFFDGTVNLLEIDLAQIEKYPRLQKRLAHLDLHGSIKGAGKVTIEADKKRACIDALMELEINDCKVAGASFTSVKDVSCHFTSNRGLTLRRINTTLQPFRSKLNLEVFDYNFINDEIAFEGLEFDIPAEQLGGVSSFLSTFFVKTDFFQHLKELKKEGHLKGILDLEITPPHFALKAQLENGNYSFLNQTYALENVVFDYDPCEARMKTDYVWQDQIFNIQILSNTSQHDQGEMTFKLAHASPVETPLTIHWKWDEQIYFERVFGMLPGLEFDFVRDPSREPNASALFLQGELRINGDEITPLCTEAMNTFLKEWNIGSGYTLKGNLTAKRPAQSCFPEVFFHGDLIGSDFFCKGYQFDYLNAKIDIAPSYVTLRSIEMTDSCGVVYSDRAELYQDMNQQWRISIPQLKVNEFQPSLLREMGMNYAPIRKALVIHSITLDNLQGDLANPASLIGEGSLYFSNPTRKNHANNILAIPVEIIRRIGLDTKILTPVKGTIFYAIQNNRIHLTKFKDVYSEGKLSRFFLAENENQSFIDFKGNLNVQIRMKQNNLVFKLTELFVVSIKGTLFDPVYTMHKQSKD